jgi:hypothetical protein
MNHLRFLKYFDEVARAGSIRQAELLSTTKHPASANFGAHSVEVAPPAEKMAKSGFIATASAKVRTT